MPRILEERSLDLDVEDGRERVRDRRLHEFLAGKLLDFFGGELLFGRCGGCVRFGRGRLRGRGSRRLRRLEIIGGERRRRHFAIEISVNTTTHGEQYH